MTDHLMDSPELDTLSRSLSRTAAILAGPSDIAVTPTPAPRLPASTPPAPAPTLESDIVPVPPVPVSVMDTPAPQPAVPVSTAPVPASSVDDPLVQQMLAGFDPARYVGAGTPVSAAVGARDQAPGLAGLPVPAAAGGTPAGLDEPPAAAGRRRPPSVLDAAAPAPHAGPRDKRDVMHMLRELSELRDA